MTRKLVLATIAATTVLALSLLTNPVFAPGPPKICEFIDDTNCTIEFSWDPADSSSDPNNLVVVAGSFTRQGLVSDSTTDVQGQLSGSLVGTLKTISEHEVTTTAGTTTITTSVHAQSRNVNYLAGEAQIEGTTYSIQIKTPGYESTQLNVDETFESPTSIQTLNQVKLTIPVIVTMCSDETCFQGFGTIRRESSQTSIAGTSITFATDELESEVIGEDGLFKLKLSKLSRIVVTTP